MLSCSTAASPFACVLVQALLGDRKPYFLLNQDVRLAALRAGSLIIMYCSWFVAPRLNGCNVIFAELFAQGTVCGISCTDDESSGFVKEWEVS